MNKILVRACMLWLPFVVALTGIFGFVYLAVQQNYRQSANDPQIQMAEDDAQILSESMIHTIVPASSIVLDMSVSFSPWTAIYDASGTPLAYSETLDGEPPQLPLGLFDPATWSAHTTWITSNRGAETRVTWQPGDGARQAVVLVQAPQPSGEFGPSKPLYVAVGRPLKLVEDRITDLTKVAVLAWGVTLVGTFVAILALVASGWL